MQQADGCQITTLVAASGAGWGRLVVVLTWPRSSPGRATVAGRVAMDKVMRLLPCRKVRT